MVESSFEEFRHLVLSDESLQRQLRDETDRLRFVARVVELGASSGFEFTPADVEQAMNTARRDWLQRMI